jgi:hypothetical protein
LRGYVRRFPVCLGKFARSGRVARLDRADDVMDAAAVYWGQTAGVDGLERDARGLVVLRRCGEGKGQVEAGECRAARPRRRGTWCLDLGKHLASDSLGSRVSDPGQCRGDVGMRLRRIVPVVMLGTFRQWKWRNEALQLAEYIVRIRALAEARPRPAFLRHRLDVHAAGVGGDFLSTAGQVSSTPEVTCGEGLPRSRLQHPRGKVGLLGLTGQLRGSAQVSIARTIVVQIDETRRCLEGQPAPRDQQPSVQAKGGRRSSSWLT